MILELLIALTLGILTGVVTGLIPGIHINLVVAALLTFTLTNVQETTLIVYIVALAITHTFIDFIPSIFLGAASEDTAISILPGHKLLLQGKGQQAVTYTVIGSVIAIASLIIVIPVLYFILTYTYDTIEIMLGYILLITSLILITSDNQSKLFAGIIFILSGLLGIITMNSTLTQPLLPLLSGLFGASTLINTINQETIIPKQKNHKIKITKKEIIKPTILTIVVSPCCSLLPGLGSSQAAVLASKIKETTQKEFLILLGSINTLVIATSFVTLYLIGKTRTGASVAIAQITTPTIQIVLTIIITIAITTIIITPFTLFLSKKIATKIHKIPYKTITISILTFLTILIIALTGIFGLLIYINATVIGLLTIKRGVSKSHLMGGILLPTLLYYLPF